MAIRYDKKLSREIAKTVRNFNTKVRRLERLERELVPSRVSVAILKQEYTDRNALQRRLKELQAFGKRGAEEIITTAGGVRTTRYDIKLTKERARIAKIRLTREINILGQATPTVYGKKTPRRFVEMGSEELSNLQARRQRLNKNIETMTKAQYERYQDLLRETYKRWDSNQGRIFRQSYYQILQDMAQKRGADPADVEKIIKALDKLNQVQLGAVYDTEQAFKDILHSYQAMKLNAGVITADTAQDIHDLAEVIDSLVDMYA